MQQGLEQMGLYSYDVDMLVAHGNGNQKSDDSEALAIAEVFGERSVPVTAFKPLMGHTLCASGLIDTTLAIQALQHKHIPAIINCKKAAPQAETLDLVFSAREMKAQLPTAMVINRGFGSMNAMVAFKACEHHE
jgi:3-oxoacyl-[acyl-carrier-protein] synthase-1